jgi:voltage-gated potassium channel
VIFETGTCAGKLFDLALLVAIVLSVLTVMLESVEELRQQHGSLFVLVEWGFTILFTAEYVPRLYSVPTPLLYAR